MHCTYLIGPRAVVDVAGEVLSNLGHPKCSVRAACVRASVGVVSPIVDMSKEVADEVRRGRRRLVAVRALLASKALQ